MNKKFITSLLLPRNTKQSCCALSYRGVAMVEIIVASAIIITSFLAIIGVYSGLSTLSLRALPKIQAVMIAEEGIEAIRSMRDAGYTNYIANLSLNTPYYLIYSQQDSRYSATTSTVVLDSQFYRTVELNNVYRDGSYNIASSGNLDVDTKKATITVSWKEGSATSTHVLESYMFNTFNN